MVVYTNFGDFFNENRNSGNKYMIGISVFVMVIGLLLALIPIEAAIDVFLIIAGVLLLIQGIFGVLSFIDNKNPTLLVKSIIYLALGIMLIVVKSYIVNLVCGGYILLVGGLKTYEYFRHRQKSAGIFELIQTILLATIVIIFGFSEILRITRIVLGCIIIAVGLVMLVFYIIKYFKERNNKDNFNSNNRIQKDSSVFETEIKEL